MNDARCSCRTCGLLWVNADLDSGDSSNCPRCWAKYKPENKEFQLQRSLLFVIAGYILYIPANIYPVMVLEKFGNPMPSTIFEGIRELIHEELYPIAAIVFTASIVIPLFKLIGMSLLLINLRVHSLLTTEHASKLLWFIRVIGRWSMLDVLMVFFLSGLIQMQSMTAVYPGVGLVAFSMVVIVTIISAESFDSRWIWKEIK